jgi:hypothetical protein
MSRWLPCKRRTFISRLGQLGFVGPYAGKRHEFIVYENHRLSIPSNSEFSIPQLKMMLNEVQDIIGRSISPDEWNGLD